MPRLGRVILWKSCGKGLPVCREQGCTARGWRDVVRLKTNG